MTRASFAVVSVAREGVHETARRRTSLPTWPRPWRPGATASSRPSRDGDEVRLAEWQPRRGHRRSTPIPVNSAKDFLFPRSEVIGRYTARRRRFHARAGRARRRQDGRPGRAAVRCRGAGLLDTVFNWDYKDAFYNARRAATTVVTAARARRPTTSASARASAARPTPRAGPTPSSGRPTAAASSSWSR